MSDSPTDVETLEAWSKSLIAKCPNYEELVVEKQAGWDSAAVEWHWRERDKQFAGNVDRTRNKGMVPSTTKYVRFYREWMPKLSQPLFGRGNEDAAERRFADIGSSPGGMCEYLVGDLGWSGAAFSLAPEAAGFGMSFTHSRLAYRDADFAQPDAWMAQLDLCPAGSCDFVNAGIVVDRGQKAIAGTQEAVDGAQREAALRGKAPPAADSAGATPATAGSAEKEGAEVVMKDHLAIFVRRDHGLLSLSARFTHDGGHFSSTPRVGDRPHLIIRPVSPSDGGRCCRAGERVPIRAARAQAGRLALLRVRRQTRRSALVSATVLRRGLTCDGGGFSDRYQLGQTALLFRMLCVLRPAFELARVTPTFAQGRTPIYVYLGGYKGVSSQPAQAAASFFEETPLGPSGFKQWHVTEWSAEAEAILAELLPDLSYVWAEQTRHLRKQRIDAERAYYRHMAMEGKAEGKVMEGRISGGGEGYGRDAGRGARERRGERGSGDGRHEPSYARSPQQRPQPNSPMASPEPRAAGAEVKMEAMRLDAPSPGKPAEDEWCVVSKVRERRKSGEGDGVGGGGGDAAPSPTAGGGGGEPSPGHRGGGERGERRSGDRGERRSGDRGEPRSGDRGAGRHAGSEAQSGSSWRRAEATDGGSGGGGGGGGWGGGSRGERRSGERRSGERGHVGGRQGGAGAGQQGGGGAEQGGGGWRSDRPRPPADIN